MKANSLRGRLMAWQLAILAVSLVLFSVLLHQWLSRSLYRHHDAELAVEAARLAPTLVGLELSRETSALALESPQVTEQFAIVRNPRGEMLYRSPSLQLSEPSIGRQEVLVHAATVGATRPQFFTVELESAGPVRFICVPIDTRPRAYLQLGRPLGDVPDTLRAVVVACALLVPVILFVMSFGGWIVASRALAPVKAIDETLQSIQQATDLSRRIDVPVDAELERLVATLNRLLDRLEKAFSSLKQFTADVSHQLQTPLTVMKGTAEVALKSTHSPAEYQRTLAELGEEVDEMARILADLRALTLADGANGGQRGPVDLSESVNEATEIIEALAESKAISITSTIEPGVNVWGNRIGLKQVLLNLGDNAVKYTTTGGRISITLKSRGPEAVVTISDTGAGIPTEDLPRIFDRFYRGSGTPRASDGTGLGLAIVKRIVEAHSGSIAVESRPTQGSTFTVTLPLAP